MCEGGMKRDWNRYDQGILPLMAQRGIYYGEIMIYVNGRRDVRLSKGWRYKPIMINAPIHQLTQPPVHSCVTRGEAPQHFCAFLTSSLLCMILSGISTTNKLLLTLLFMSFRRLCCAAHLLSAPCDPSMCRPVPLPHDGFL